MAQNAIEIHDLGKEYRRRELGKGRYKTLRESLTSEWWKRKPKNEDDFFWALRHINLEIPQGEIVGVIGPNGAGKSTLLKLLTRVTAPTEGHFTLRGRVASLLEVGTGFHPELTGRENIYLSGTIMGMKRVEINEKFDEIVAFSGVEKFLDLPVKRYSSGMFVRLGFAVAAHLEAEILLVDEVLAVGDAEFQKKCLGKMGDVAQSGRTVLFVSHNLGAVRELCETCFKISDGSGVYYSHTDQAIQSYLSELETRPKDNLCKYLKEVTVRSEKSLEYPFYYEYEFNIKLSNLLQNSDLIVGINIKSKNGNYLLGINNLHYSQKINNGIKTNILIKVKMPFLPFFPGEYYIDLFFDDLQNELKEVWYNAYCISVDSKVSIDFSSINTALNNIIIPKVIWGQE